MMVRHTTAVHRLQKFLGFTLLLVLPVLMLVSPTGANAYDKEKFAAIEQPIKFSHKTHALTNEISCEFCHSEARRSRYSGVPPVRTCVGCHIVIAGQTEEQQSEIKKVMGYWERKEPIPWKKIHDLPDHAKFSHKRHVTKGFDCTSCHGDVSASDAPPVPQPARGQDPLTMGWCISCHREQKGVTAEGKIALPIRETRGGKIIAEAPPAVATIKGNVDCTVCHK